MRKTVEMMNDECRMQNEDKAPTKAFPGRLFSFCILHSAFCIYLSGCAATPPAPAPKPPASLVAANQALAAHQPDQAIADARQYLQGQPYGPAAAQAHYFEGRGWEMKVAATQDEAQRNLFEARSCYLEALSQNPAPSVEGDIRASLSNGRLLSGRLRRSNSAGDDGHAAGQFK